MLSSLVGGLDAFRILLLEPIFDRVLSPGAPEGPIMLGLAKSRWHFDLRQLVPHFLHLHNPWDVVAFALVVATILKGLCDYLGNYLVNYAGFGTITDLRNHLYEATLRRSSSFFHKHPTGTILSTLINDVERVQNALSSVLGDFLQQFFTFVVAVVFVINIGGHLSWALVLFIPVVITSARKIGREVRTRTRTGQDKLAEIQNILHETVTGNRIVKAFNTELWEILRFKKAATKSVPRQPAQRAHSVHQFAADGHHWSDRDCRHALWIGRNGDQGRPHDSGRFWGVSSFCCSSSTIRCASLRFSTTAFSRRWERRPQSSCSSTPKTM